MCQGQELDVAGGGLPTRKSSSRASAFQLHTREFLSAHKGTAATVLTKRASEIDSGE